MILEVCWLLQVNEFAVLQLYEVVKKMKTTVQFPEFIKNFPKAKLPLEVKSSATFLDGEAGQVVFHTIPKGQGVPPHQHKDSYAVIISGALEFILGDEQFIFYPGKSLYIPEGILHGGKALEDTLLIEVFCENRWSAA